MFQLVKECQKSGLSRKAFAHQHGVSEKSLEYWFRKQSKRKSSLVADTSMGKANDSAPSFVEIVNQSSKDPINRHPQVELELANGICIKIY
jgi:transposase-like protein